MENDDTFAIEAMQVFEKEEFRLWRVNTMRMTQQQLGSAMGLTRHTIIKYENGSFNIHRRMRLLMRSVEQANQIRRVDNNDNV